MEHNGSLQLPYNPIHGAALPSLSFRLSVNNLVIVKLNVVL